MYLATTIISKEILFLHNSFTYMNIVRLYADLQAKPTKLTYQQIADYFKSCNKDNESEAFEELIKKRYGCSTHTHQEQQSNNQENS